MKFRTLLTSIMLSLFMSINLHGQTHIIDMQGKWGFRIDSTNIGIEQEWYNVAFTDEIDIPGALQNQG